MEEWRVGDYQGMRKFIALGLLSLTSALGTTFTTVNPPPGTEGDTRAIIASTFPDYLRLSDASDIFWNTAHGEYVIAFEDHPTGDFDFNDSIYHIVMSNGAVESFDFAGSWSAVVQGVGFDGTFWYNTTVLGTMWSNPAFNSSGMDHMVTWAKESVSEVPEPGTMLLFGSCLLFVAGLRWSRLW